MPDGRPMPQEIRKRYLEQLTAPPKTEWNVQLPSRGLGDTVAKITHATGLDKVAHKAAAIVGKKDCGCSKRQARLNQWWGYAETAEPPPFVTLAQMAEDCKALASMLPANTARIVGVSRSGLQPANLVAMLLHRQLWIVRQSTADIIDGGNGWRLSGNTTADGPTVVIDDTVMSGNSFKHVMPIVRKRFPDAIAAACYVNPMAKVKPDMWVRDLCWPHLLEWNLFNSIMTPIMATDFDGVLCRDCPPEDDDDGPRYEAFLRDVQPLYLVRRTPIPLIVTARMEKYRPQTEDWLKRHGVKWTKLVMGPWRTLAERNRSDIAGFKAQHFKLFIRQYHRLKPPLFVESDPRQAKRIAELSRGTVICPVAGKCF